jgi:predicted dehydrogenase
MINMYSLGILGVGEGRSIISAAQQSEHWTVGQICDLNEDRCKSRVSEFQLERYTLSYEEMLADPTIDAIAIYTPDPLHAQHVLQAIEAGKHVICTKPFLDSLDRGAEILDASQKHGTHLMVGQSSRFVESMRRQRKDVEEGLLGDIITMEAHYYHDHRNYMRYNWGPGMIPSMKWTYMGVSHPLDLVRWYMPEVDEVFGYGTISPFGKEVGLQHPDVLHFVLRTSDGRVASVRGVYGLPEQHTTRDSWISCTLRGTKGSSTGDYPHLHYHRNLEGQEPEKIEFDHLAPYYYRFEGIHYHAGEFQNYLDAFAQGLDQGVPAQPDLRDGLITVATLRAMERSLQEGCPIRVKDVLQQANLGELIKEH